MTRNGILAVVEFMGDKLTEEDAQRLMDEARNLSVAEREELLMLVDGPLYTELSMHDGEMGGLSRY